MLTNNVVSFEQPGPYVYGDKKELTVLPNTLPYQELWVQLLKVTMSLVTEMLHFLTYCMQNHSHFCGKL